MCVGKAWWKVSKRPSILCNLIIWIQFTSSSCRFRRYLILLLGLTPSNMSIWFLIFVAILNRFWGDTIFRLLFMLFTISWVSLIDETSEMKLKIHQQYILFDGPWMIQSFGTFWIHFIILVMKIYFWLQFAKNWLKINGWITWDIIFLVAAITYSVWKSKGISKGILQASRNMFFEVYETKLEDHLSFMHWNK